MKKYGARKGSMTTLRSWIARASARDIRIFPVPGADILRLYADETSAGVRMADSPRRANVLVVVGPLTPPLARLAGVAYQQMPRPRVLVSAGSPSVEYLPAPDVQLPLEQGFLEEALPQVRRLLRGQAWSESAEPWEPEYLADIVDDDDSDSGGHDHHHDHDHGNGEDDGDDGDRENGHDHQHGQQKGGDGQAEDAHARHDHGGEHHEEHAEDEAGDEDVDSHERGHDHAYGSGDENGAGDEDGDGGGHSHDHGDMDFMSMVEMTKDLPRPRDGLPMNRSEVHFGPFHPGLPGGLSVFMELDGDTVIEARVQGDAAARSPDEVLPFKASDFPEAFARLNPLAPQTWRLLARKALRNAAGEEDPVTAAALEQLERERIGSHLNWLATFGKTVGSEWMHREAARRHYRYRRGEGETEELEDFLHRIRSMPYLQQKLSMAGGIPAALTHHLSGPVAKAAGKTDDSRSGDETYRSLGWEPVTAAADNAWGRLQVRLDEITQSLKLIEEARRQDAGRDEIDFSGSGEGEATLEGPRGTLRLQLRVQEGSVTALALRTPSTALAALVPTLTEEAELSDALVQIASLDIAPWAIEPETAGGHV